MKKLTMIAVAGAFFSAPAMAQDNGLDALLGANGPIQGLVTTLTTANAQPLIDGLTSNSGLLQGNIAGPLNNALTGLLVNQDPGQVASGLQNTLTLTLDSAVNGLVGGGAAVPGLDGLPGLDALPGAGGLPDAGGLPSLPGLDGTGSAGLSPDQLGELAGMLGG